MSRSHFFRVQNAVDVLALFRYHQKYSLKSQTQVAALGLVVSGDIFIRKRAIALFMRFQGKRSEGANIASSIYGRS